MKKLIILLFIFVFVSCSYTDIGKQTEVNYRLQKEVLLSQILEPDLYIYKEKNSNILYLVRFGQWMFVKDTRTVLKMYRIE